MQSARQLVIVLILLFMLVGGRSAQPAAASALAAPVPAPLLQASQLAMTNPTACPSTGCAAGQRFNLRFTLNPTGYDYTQTDNVKVCVYAPKDWVDPTAPEAVTGALTGVATGTAYNPVTALTCDGDTNKPANYRVILERTATLAENIPVDALDFAFRTLPSAIGSGQIQARLFVKPSSGVWSAVPFVTTPLLTMRPPASRMYVANDALSCGSQAPCYLNSGDDLDLGIGTGLKDAIDAAPNSDTTLYVQGLYTIKSKTVVVDKPLTITGSGDATITYADAADCSNGMISLNAGVSLQGLNIDDGACTNPNRNLVTINSSTPVQVTSNDLTQGNNAIEVMDNSGNVTISFNHFSGNAGFAVYSQGNSQKGPLNVVANNLSDNGAGVECAPSASAPLDYRRADHNYWGSKLPSNPASTHCTITAGKRLGMPIAHNTSLPGVDAKIVGVSPSLTYSFNNQIGYNRTGGSKDFNLYIINHGYASAGGPPFSFANGSDSPSPCSNYWDIFLPENETADGTLELYFRYNDAAGCSTTIRSIYCDQTDMGKYPLYWLDPVNNSTDSWDPTGAKPVNLTRGDGQVTTCHTGTNEIQVSIDNSGRPGLVSDLSYTPFMVGIPVINTFRPLASLGTVTVTWTTNYEPDISGFYVLRGLDRNSLNPITDLINHTGTALAGKTYSYIDSGRSNGTTYYYRLKIMRSDGTAIYTDIKSVTVNAATATAPIPTATYNYYQPSRTPTITLVPFQNPTRVPSRTATLRITTPSPTFLSLSPVAGTPGTAIVALPGQSGTPGAGGTGVPGGYPASGTGTPIAFVPTPTSSATFGPAGSVTNVSGGGVGTLPGASPWVSLLLGILAGLAAVGGLGALWYWRGRS